jgi:DNA adenine methylase
MKPIIKWVGGKTQLLETIRKMLPSGWIRYYEPFLGGGALLLDFDIDIVASAVVNDINPELMNMYIQVRDNVEELIKCLTIMDDIHERSLEPKVYYYKVRSGFNKNLGTNTSEQAARLIYLNKHCFNGLYRVNSKGEFNVPFNGKLTGRSFDPDHLREVSTKLKLVEFKLGDFAAAVANARSGDFVFFDSPYAPLTPTSFTDYTKEGFSYDDHVRLADLFKDLTNRGVKCMLTNHDTDLIRELYKDFTITEVEVSRNINRNGSDRKGKELIITNY